LKQIVDRPNAILLIAHPGHELRLHHWLELARPTVFVLTDGSAAAGHSRMPSTIKVLNQTGAHAGAVLGRFTDHEIYEAIMNRDTDKVAQVTRELAVAFADAGLVVTDASEGYNPTHDLCGVVAELAIELASQIAARRIPLYDYAVTELFETLGDEDEIVVKLDDDAFARKLAAALGYSELRSDVEDMIRQHGPERLKLEVMRPSTAPKGNVKPLYETRGEQQVAAGRYKSVLRHREHFAPFVDALRSAVRTAPLVALSTCFLVPLA
jgi:hypothetical protein